MPESYAAVSTHDQPRPLHAPDLALVGQFIPLQTTRRWGPRPFLRDWRVRASSDRLDIGGRVAELELHGGSRKATRPGHGE